MTQNINKLLKYHDPGYIHFVWNQLNKQTKPRTTQNKIKESTLMFEYCLYLSVHEKTLTKNV